METAAKIALVAMFIPLLMIYFISYLAGIEMGINSHPIWFSLILVSSAKIVATRLACWDVLCLAQR